MALCTGVAAPLFLLFGLVFRNGRLARLFALHLFLAASAASLILAGPAVLNYPTPGVATCLSFLVYGWSWGMFDAPSSSKSESGLYLPRRPALLSAHVRLLIFGLLLISPLFYALEISQTGPQIFALGLSAWLAIRGFRLVSRWSSAQQLGQDILPRYQGYFGPVVFVVGSFALTFYLYWLSPR